MALEQETLHNTINTLAQEIINNEEQDFIWDKSYSWNEVFNCSLLDLRECIKELDESIMREADKEIFDESQFQSGSIDLYWMTEVATNEAIKILVSKKVDDLESKFKM